MATTVSAAKCATRAIRPRLLVVDDEPDLIALIRDVVGPQLDCKILAAKDMAEARRILAREPVELLVTDLHLPDGDGTALLSTLRQQQPNSEAIIITGKPSVGAAINAMRAGAADFLPKPFSADTLLTRVNSALERQRLSAKTDKRLDRLRDAVKKLNASRRTVSKKVDLLCNDLVNAYGDLAKQ